MIDYKSIIDYDQFVDSISSNKLETIKTKWKLFRKARIIKTSSNDFDFNKECDVIVIGGGPSGLLIGSMLAKHGHRVTLFEKNKKLFCGATWNVSRPEFEKLKKLGILSPQEWESIITGEYQEGLFRLFDSHSTPPKLCDYHFDEILNLSINEELFYKKLIDKKSENLEIKPGCLSNLKGVNDRGVYVSYNYKNDSCIIKGKLLIDACGWTSTIAKLIHPKREIESVYNIVGIHCDKKLPHLYNTETGKLTGIIGATFEDEINTKAGDVQPILERFCDHIPDKIDKGDVLYYFTRTAKPEKLYPMLSVMKSRLYQIIDGFEEEYANKTFFGHIPAYYPPKPFSKWHIQTSAGDRILLAGTAAQQYSGLTGCVFGALARNVCNICNSIDNSLQLGKLSFKDLSKIDIDKRERISQVVEEMFGGSMELDYYEKYGTVNRDWLTFMQAADEMNQQLKNEAFRDKIQLKTLHQLLYISLKKPSIITSLLRNNSGHVGTIVWTFIQSYIQLLLIEISYVVTRRKTKYIKASFMALYKLPFHLINSSRLYIQAIGETRKKRRK